MWTWNETQIVHSVLDGSCWNKPVARHLFSSHCINRLSTLQRSQSKKDCPIAALASCPTAEKATGAKKWSVGWAALYGKPTFPKRLVVPTSHPESGCQAKHVAETTHPTASMYGRYTYLRRYLPNISSQCKHISYVIVFSHQESLLTSINRCCITLGRCCPRWRWMGTLINKWIL